jgi:DNA-binding transcriptional ArsR family regulator
MDSRRAGHLFVALASPIRLDIYRRLVRAAPDGMVAGEIADTLRRSPSNVSFHLKELARANLVVIEREGRFQRCRANLPLMTDLLAFLTDECCSGHPEQCVDLVPLGPTVRRPRARAASRTGPAQSRPTPLDA